MYIVLLVSGTAITCLWTARNYSARTVWSVFIANVPIVRRVRSGQRGETTPSVPTPPERLSPPTPPSKLSASQVKCLDLFFPSACLSVCLSLVCASVSGMCVYVAVVVVVVVVEGVVVVGVVVCVFVCVRACGVCVCMCVRACVSA